MKNRNRIWITMLSLLGVLGISPIAPAVVPAPNGCYPGFTTAEGCNALNSLTSGAGNTGVGWHSLFWDSTGSYNTGIGGGALALNNADSNTAVGAAALLLNTNGTGVNSGTQNVAVGTDALVFNAGGSIPESGSYNDAVGAFALFNNINGSDNNAFGNSALFSNINASNNTAVGGGALFNNDSLGGGIGGENTAVGAEALQNNIDGRYNTAVGYEALQNSTGDYNTALGAGAGAALGLGSNNILIGDAGFSSSFDVISIGAIPASGTPYSRTYIGGIHDSVEQDRPVYVDSQGHLGSPGSSRRYKEEIKPMDNASEALFALKPVTFRYKQQIDPSHRLSFGLVAEDVAKVSADLISRDKDGKPQTVRYEAVNAMLLNEFLKEHKKVEDLEKTFQTTAAQQEKEITALLATVKAQAEQIQKVSAQVELHKASARAVQNDR
jgi:trimeric autotransporter adhesin